MKFATKDAAHHHIIQSAHLRKWPRGLKGPTNTQFLDLVGFAQSRFFVGKQNSAARCSVAAGDQIEQGRLPSPIGSNETDDFTFVDAEVDLLQGPMISEFFTQCFQF